MAEEIGALRAVLALESAAFDRGVQSARRSLTNLEGGFQKTGGQVVNFSRSMSRDASAGFAALGRSSGMARAGLQNFGFQVQDVAVQIAGGTSATRALSQQLPQLLSGFGLFGVALGTASAVLIPLVGYLFQAAEATKSWVDELSLTSGSISNVTGAVTALEGVQRQYVEAINAQGGASSAAASLVIANSAREFAARKQLLGVEIELLRIRGQEIAQARTNISDGIRLQAEARARSVDPGQIGLGGTDRAGGTIGDYVNIRPRNLDEMGLGGDFAQRDILAVQKLNAELELTNLTIERTDALMNSTFETISGGGAVAPSGGGGGGRSGGGGGGQSDEMREAARIYDETRTAAEKYATELARLNELKEGGYLTSDTYARAMENLRDKTGETESAFSDLGATVGEAFTSFVTGAKSGQEALSDLLSSLADTLANSAFQAIAGSLFGGGSGGGFLSGLLGNADGNAFSGGRVAAFANGGIVTGPTVFPMANGAGLMGEAGPEAIMPLTRIGGKLGVRATGGGGTVINIDARGAVEGTAVQIERALARVIPGIVQQSVAGTRAAGARGY